MDERLIRQYFNEYSRSTTGHPYTNLGDDINITVNDDCLVKKCYLRTQYEARKSSQVSEPYRGGALPVRKYFSLNDVNAWAYNLQTPDKFTNKDSYVNVEGSQWSETCSACKGKGEEICSVCHGQASQTCPVCKGTSNITCSSCGGSGYVLCPDCHGEVNMHCNVCGGKGSITKTRKVQKHVYNYQLQQDELKYVDETYTERCSACYGKGRWTCTTCKDSYKRGYITCRKCSNTGYVTCDNCSHGLVICKSCNGKGKYVCASCKGAGAKKYGYVVDRKLWCEERTQITGDPRLEEFIGGFDFDNVPVEFRDKKKKFGSEIYPADPHCNSILCAMANEASAQNGKILFQEAIVLGTVMTYIVYNFKGKQYDAIVCDRQLYIDNSPIDEWSKHLTEKASDKLKWGSSVAALDLLEQATEAKGGTTREIRYMIDEAEGRLENIHSAGVSAAFWLSAIVLSPILYNFYDKLNPVAPWAIVTNNPKWSNMGLVPISQTLMFLAAILIVRASFMNVSEKARTKRHDSIWSYFSRGFFGYFAACIGVLAVLIALNYFGLSIVTTFVIGTIIKVIAVVVGIAYLLAKWIIQFLIKIIGKIF